MSTRPIETAEEAHFLVRVGSWSAEDLEAWARSRESEVLREDEEFEWDEEVDYSDYGEEEKL